MKQQYRQQCEERQEQVIGMYLNQERWENPADYYLRREWKPYARAHSCTR